MSNSESHNNGTGAENGMSHEQELASLREAWSELRQDEPPELVDRAVLNRARRDLEKPRGKRIRWVGGFATAAVVVVALSLVLQQAPQPPIEIEKQDVKPLQAPQASRAKAEARRDEPAADLQEEDVSREVQKRRAMPSAASAAAAPPAPASRDSAIEDALNARSAEPVAESFADEDKLQEQLDSEAEAWIDRLLELHRQGENNRLAEELAAFRAAYPGYALPPELAGN